MAEVGCVKDGNFQNLETNNLFLSGNSLLTSTYVSIGGIADDQVAVAATGLTKNAIHVINGNLTTAGTKIILPSKAQVATFGLEIGDFYTFVVGVRSTRAGGHQISTDAADDGGGAGAYLLGGVKLVRAASGVANAASGNNQPIEVSNIWAVTGTDEMVVMDADDAVGGGEAGSFVTFRYLGNIGANSIPGWMLNGEIISTTAATTGVATFIPFA
jgi:hypothetical protein